MEAGATAVEDAEMVTVEETFALSAGAVITMEGVFV
jgi:hypothetical protein